MTNEQKLIEAQEELIELLMKKVNWAENYNKREVNLLRCKIRDLQGGLESIQPLPTDAQIHDESRNAEAECCDGCAKQGFVQGAKWLRSKLEGKG